MCPLKILYSSLAPRVVSVSAARLGENSLNFTVVVVFTGSGPDGALALTNIEFREGNSNTSFESHVGDLGLRLGIDNVWHVMMFNSQLRSIVTTIEYRLRVLNNLGLGTTVGGYAVHGKH